VQGWKSCPQLTNFNFNYCKMVKDMGLKLLHRGPLEWHYLTTKYHENLQAVQKLLVRTHRWTGDLISLLSFLECRIK
jgi:hypothetical protein